MRKTPNRLKVALVPMLALLTCSVALGQAKEETKKEKKPAKIASVNIEKKAVRIFDIVNGIFEASNSKEIRLDFETWTDLKVKEVVAEGSRVESGTTLIEFDDESIDKAIKEAEFAYQTSAFAFEDAKLALKQAEITQAMDLDVAERSWKNAREDHDYYLNVTVPERLKELDYSLKTAGYSLEYSKDELDQLEQMYNEDELTEESEAIVLKRAERSVESSERYMNKTVRRIDQQRRFTAPRTDKSQEDRIARQKLTFEKAIFTLPIKTKRAEIALRKAKFDLANKKEKLEELKSDRKRFSVVSPASGTVYYGRCADGKWIGPAGSAARKIEIDSKLTAKKVVMTIVDLEHQTIRATVTEEQLGRLKSGNSGTAQTKISTGTFPVSIKSISQIPVSVDTFVCQLELESPQTVSSIMPGMSSKISFLTFEDDAAIVAPKASVFSDDGGISHFVFVVVDNVASQKPIRAGRTQGDKIVILDGLNEGDVIATKRQ